jgi:hypothetical protein
MSRLSKKDKDLLLSRGEMAYQTFRKGLHTLRSTLGYACLTGIFLGMTEAPYKNDLINLVNPQKPAIVSNMESARAYLVEVQSEISNVQKLSQLPYQTESLNEIWGEKTREQNAKISNLEKEAEIVNQDIVKMQNHPRTKIYNAMVKAKGEAENEIPKSYNQFDSQMFKIARKTGVGWLLIALTELIPLALGEAIYYDLIRKRKLDKLAEGLA